MGQLPGLDGAVPDIGKLARELQVRPWCLWPERCAAVLHHGLLWVCCGCWSRRAAH